MAAVKDTKPAGEVEAPAEKPAQNKTGRKPAPWKPQEFAAKKGASIGNKKTVAEGETVVPVNPRQEDELRNRGII